MRIVKKDYKYYEVISETAKMYNARELAYKLSKTEEGQIYTKTDDGHYISYGEGTKYTETYESGVYEPYTKIRRFSKAKYEVKEVPNKWETYSVSYQW